MSKPLFIYLAGPYTKPEPVTNTKRAIAIGNWLLDNGYLVFVPHLSMFQQLDKPRTWEEWMEIDKGYVARCDVLVRIQGESAGADVEVAEAMRLMKPICEINDTPESRERVLRWLEDRQDSMERRGSDE